MDWKAWVLPAIFLVLVVVIRLNHWLATLDAEKLIQNIKEGKHKAVGLIPESLFVVECSDWSLTCRDPKGGAEMVAWDDLVRVEIVTNDHGPFLPDCFWVLQGEK